MTRKHSLAAAVLAIVAGALIGVGQPEEAQLWRHRNLGKALYENPSTQAQAPEELKKALDLAPDSFRDRLNYGMALLRAGNLEQAVAELEKAQKQDPRSPYTWFNLGIAFKRLERPADAIRQFERMVRLAPEEPVSHYNLGVLYLETGRAKEGLQELAASARLDPLSVAPRFRIYNYHRLNSDEATAERAYAEFEKVREQQPPGESQDMEWSVYAELYDPVQARPAAADRTPAATVTFEDRVLPGRAESANAGLLALDADGDGRPDLLVWSAAGVLLFRNGTGPVAPSGLEELRNVVAAAAGDFDNDGLADLCLLTASSAALYRNAGGRFEKAPAAMPDRSFRAAVWLDFDHDYDLDLFLLGPRPALLRNTGASAFEDYTAHFPFVEGTAISAVAVRPQTDGVNFDLAVTYQDRGAVLYRDRLRGVFDASPLAALPAAATGLVALDIDNDGAIDLAAATAAGAVLGRNQVIRGCRPFALADLENRGYADLVCAGAVWRNQGLRRFSRSAPSPIASVSAWAAADFDGDGRTDLAAVASGGTLHLLLNRTASRNQYVRVSLAGVKNLKTAAGAEVEVKSGAQYQRRSYAGVPLLFGLGERTRVDTIRIGWPNGMIQNQTGEPASRTVSIKEAPRLSSSCPMIFTWNGRAFEFLTDVLGVAPLGASSGDGSYFPVDHDEYVRIPAASLAATGGNYEVRITEELHEVSYLDQVRLFAVDHAAGTEILTNEKFKAPPFPEFRLFGVRSKIRPAAARDGRGRDLRAALLRRDGLYAGGFRHDAAGAAEMHSLTLDFGRAAAPGGKALLVLDGWVDWADGSTFYGVSQTRPGGLTFPYLQVRDRAGAWRTVIDDMGIPAGKPKTIVVDLSGKFLSASREIRIVTDLCVYWDEIYLSEDTAPPAARLTPIDAGAAFLRLRGFSRNVVDPRRERPEQFDYARWTPAASWNQTPGFYTRYGDVRGLVRAIDDRYVIMGSGDELRLLFPAAALTPLAPGERRDFLLLVDGWAKDADANTAHSQTVDPLPFHGMSRYPYPATEHYPDDLEHQRYRETCNTRPAIRFLTSLAPGSRR